MIKTFYSTLVCLMCCCNFLYAQKAPAWGGGADVTDLSFGFSFTYVSSYLKINKQPDWQQAFIDPENGSEATGKLAGISSPNEPGFAVGFLTRYRLTDHLEVRTTPSLVFANRKLIYKYQDTNVPDKIRQLPTTAFDIPLQIKLKSDRIGDFRGYLIGGAKITAAIGKKNEDKNKALSEKEVKYQQYFGSYEAGVGIDIYFEFFKLSPEIKISNSFGNVLKAENHPYSRPLTGLGLHTIQFSLYFE